MNTLLYFCYGARKNFDEARYSLLSSTHCLAGDTPRYQRVVYTDDPAAFADLGVVTVPIGAAELDAWLGGSDYIHRRKTMVVLDALARFPGNIAFIDSDTYFLKSPNQLFDRIGPRRAVLHLVEGRLRETGTLVDRSVSDMIANTRFTDRAGQPLAISPDARMWNSGVIGVHTSDMHLILEALHLSDQMWRQLKPWKEDRKAQHVEQFATGYFLERLDLREAGDVLFHYWPEHLRTAFAAQVGQLVGAEQVQSFSAAYARRPQSDLKRKLFMSVRSGLRASGIRVRGIRNSA